MIRSDAVHWGVRAGRIVRDHAAERCPGAGGDVWTEPKSMRTQESVKLLEHGARADAHRAAVHIQVSDLTIEASELHDESISNRASDQPRACAARNDRHVCVGCRADHGAGLGRVARKRYAYRLDPVDRRIRGIK